MSAVLVDTNVWIHFFQKGNPLLEAMLEDDEVLCHPIIIGELSMGGLPDREQTLADLFALDQPPVAGFAEVHRLIEGRRLWGRGLQWNDACLLASAILGDVPLWTLDRRLADAAAETGVAWSGAVE